MSGKHEVDAMDVAAAEESIEESTNRATTATRSKPTVREQKVIMCERLKRMGYATGNLMRMYGQEFELVSDPIAITDRVVVVDAIDPESGSLRRVQIPRTITNMVRRTRQVP